MPAIEILPPDAVTQRSAATDYAIEVINSLPRLARLVLLFSYCEGMTMAEIGTALGVVESRVRRVHDEALRQVQIALAC